MACLVFGTTLGMSLGLLYFSLVFLASDYDEFGKTF